MIPFAAGSSAFDLEIPAAPGALAILPRDPLPALPPSTTTPDGQLVDQSTALADELRHEPKARKRPPKPFLAPFTIAIDHRERSAAYPFTGFDAGHHHSYRPLEIAKEMKHLVTGDYSIVGCEHLICVERKALADFFGTLAGKDDNGESRLERFRREHERMADMLRAGGRCCVVIESDWREIQGLRRYHTRMSYASIRGLFEEWQEAYRVPWQFESGRRMGERATLKILWRWWNARQRQELRERERANELRKTCEELL